VGLRHVDRHLARVDPLDEVSQSQAQRLTIPLATRSPTHEGPFEPAGMPLRGMGTSSRVSSLRRLPVAPGRYNGCMRGQRDPWIEERAAEFRRSHREAENLIRVRIRARRLGGFRFRRQHMVGRFIVNSHCAELRVAIEIDGIGHDRRATPGGTGRCRRAGVEGGGSAPTQCPRISRDVSTRCLPRCGRVRHSSSGTPGRRSPGSRGSATRSL
jgi:hypothetical protein